MPETTIPEPPVVALKNGQAAPQPMVVTTLISLRALRDRNPVDFIEFVAACRDEAHPMFGRTGSAAMSVGLVQQQRFDGTVIIHDAVRDVVLSAVSGEGLNLSLGSPLAGEQE